MLTCVSVLKCTHAYLWSSWLKYHPLFWAFPQETHHYPRSEPLSPRFVHGVSQGYPFLRSAQIWWASLWKRHPFLRILKQACERVSCTFPVTPSLGGLYYQEYPLKIWGQSDHPLQSYSLWDHPASTRRGTDVIFMWVGHVEITWWNMLKCLVFLTSAFLT